MSSSKSVSEYVSELNQVFNLIIEDIENHGNKTRLSLLMDEARENGIVFVSTSLASGEHFEPAFYSDEEVRKLCERAEKARVQKIEAVKRQKFEFAAENRYVERTAILQLLDLYRTYKGNDFGHFIGEDEKTILFLPTCNHYIDRVVGVE